MIGDLLEKNLKNYKGEAILVVMDDGLAFLGKLIDHDSSTLILKDVYQTSSMTVEWEEIPEEKGRERKVGYLDWTEINLEELYLRSEHVLRIWPWKGDLEDEVQKQGKTGKKPIYSSEVSSSTAES